MLQTLFHSSKGGLQLKKEKKKVLKRKMLLQTTAYTHARRRSTGGRRVTSVAAGVVVALDVAPRQGAVVGPDGVGGLVGAEVREARRLLSGPAAVEVGEDGAAGVARGGEADEAPGRGEVGAVRLAGHLDVEHPLAVRRVRGVVHRPPPAVHARDAHHAACAYIHARAGAVSLLDWTWRRCANEPGMGLAL